MIEYLTVNASLTMLALLSLLLLRYAPARYALWTCCFAACAWLVPWHWIEVANVVGPTGTFMMNWSDALPIVAPGPIEQVAGMTLGSVVAGAILLGIGYFAFAYLRQRREVRRWMGDARSDDGVLDASQRLYIGSVKVSGRFVNAFVTGYFRPTIWLGRQLADSPLVATVVRHELTHVRQRHNFILLGAYFVRCALWFNPLVWVLSVCIHRLVELDCDERCDAADAGYRDDLAQLLLTCSAVTTPLTASALAPLRATMLGAPRFGVARIRRLQKNVRLRVAHMVWLAIMVGCSSATVTGASLGEPPAQDQTLTDLHVRIVEGQNTSEMRTQFAGADDEVRELLARARAADKLVSFDEDRTPRRIVIQTESTAQARALLEVFVGTGMHGIERFVLPADADPELAGEPLLLDLKLTVGAYEPLSVVLAATAGQWTGVHREHYIVRLLPEIVRGPDAQQDALSLQAEVSERTAGEFSVTARPRVITRFDEQARILIGASDPDSTRDVVLEMTVTPSRVN